MSAEDKDYAKQVETARADFRAPEARDDLDVEIKRVAAALWLEAQGLRTKAETDRQLGADADRAVEIAFNQMAAEEGAKREPVVYGDGTLSWVPRDFDYEAAEADYRARDDIMRGMRERAPEEDQPDADMSFPAEELEKANKGLALNEGLTFINASTKDDITVIGLGNTFTLKPGESYEGDVPPSRKALIEHELSEVLRTIRRNPTLSADELKRVTKHMGTAMDMLNKLETP